MECDSTEFGEHHWLIIGDKRAQQEHSSSGPFAL
jgi:hypothetical protein